MPVRGRGHAHILFDESVKRSRQGVRAVLTTLLILIATAAVQAFVFIVSGSVALLADLIHNAADAATAIPLGLAFALRSSRAEGWAGRIIVGMIFASAVVAGYEAVRRLADPQTVTDLGALAGAGAVGFLGNWAVSVLRFRNGRRLHSSALIADGEHARADAYVSLGVIASAVAVAAGAPIVDPLIGLAITILIMRICLLSWRTVSDSSDPGRDRPIRGSSS